MDLQNSWLTLVPEWDADIVITFPHDAKETTVLWFKQKIEDIQGIILHTKSLSTSSKHSNPMKLSRNNCHAFYVKATYECYLRGLEKMHILKPLKDEYGGGYREFIFNEMCRFKDIDNFETFFNSQERQSILIFVINRLRAQEGDAVGRHDNRVYKFRPGEALMSRSIHKKIIRQIFPVHDQLILDQLKRDWIQNLTTLPPIDGIFNYFGSKIALYFSWLQHYTCALAIHVLVGILFWMFQGRHESTIKEALVSSYDEINSILFAFFNVIWATLYLESWKRRSAELTYTWRTSKYQKELFPEPRPLFKGEERINDITDQPEIYYPARKRYVFRCLITVPAIALCLLVVFATVISALRLQDWWDKEMNVCCFVPRVLLAVTIPILNFMYNRIAIWLNDMENHRTEESYSNNMIGKLILFHFVNSFLSLFYVAFYLQDMERLKNLLTTILITRQVIGNVKETLLPYAIKYYSLLDMSLHDYSTFDPSQIKTGFSQIECENSAPNYKGTHEEYMEIFIQFGYVTFFSSIYPLAGLFALINNIFEIRGDALKLCVAYQRPFGQRVPNIGAWQVAMESMGVIAIIVNCALIGQSGQIYELFPTMSKGSMILFVVGLEHVMLLLKILIAYMIPDIPSWVQKEMTRVEHQRQELERKCTL